MPVLKTRTVAAHEVAENDIVHSRLVGEVRVGTKWADIRDSVGARILRVPLEHGVVVAREEPTEAELAAEKRASWQRWVDRANDSLQESLNDALYSSTPQELLLELARKENSFRLLGAYTLGDLMRRQVEYDFWANVDQTLKNWEARDEGAPPLAEKWGAMVAAVAIVVSTQRDTLSYRDPLSRSTSTLSNLYEDVTVAHAIGMTERYSGLVVKAALTELEAEKASWDKF